MTDCFTAIRWTYAEATVQRVRAIAVATGLPAADLLAVLRAQVYFADGDGRGSFPGQRALAAVTALGRNRIPALRDALVVGGLLVDTGRRRGLGGTAVYDVAVETGTAQDGASSGPAESGTAQGGASSPESGTELAPNWHPTGTAQDGARPRTKDHRPETAAPRAERPIVDEVVALLNAVADRRRLSRVRPERIAKDLARHDDVIAVELARELDATWRGDMDNVEGAYRTRLQQAAATARAADLERGAPPNARATAACNAALADVIAGDADAERFLVDYLLVGCDGDTFVLAGPSTVLSWAQRFESKLADALKAPVRIIAADPRFGPVQTTEDVAA